MKPKKLKPLRIEQPKNIPADIPAWIKGLRKRHSMTQKQFANSFGINLRTLQNWEAGYNRPRKAALLFLKILQLNPNLIMDAVSNAPLVSY